MASAEGPNLAINGYTYGYLDVDFCDVEGGIAGIYYETLQPDPPPLSEILDWGLYNLDADPLFVSATNHRLQCGSPCINWGNNAAVPEDFGDLDGDGNVTEDTPRDLALSPRFVFSVDQGAYETQPTESCGPDINEDGEVDVNDLILMFGAWGSCVECEADFHPDPCGDGEVNVNELLAMIMVWGTSNCEGETQPLPESIEDCYDICADTGDQWSECMEKCLESIED